MVLEFKERAQNKRTPNPSHYMIEQPSSLIGPDDPPPYEVFNPDGKATVLLACDHASRAFPEEMNCLGLEPRALRRHIASDIGSADATRELAMFLDAPAVLAGYSRLVVDLNRHLDDPTAFLAVSDGEFIPGNHGLSAEEKERRARDFFWPYHGAISHSLAAFEARGVVPALISIHSFTPFFDERNRPWEIGILWDQDPRIPLPLIESLGRRGVCVGDNQPYSGRSPEDYTIDQHAEPAGLPHVSIEIRQDLLENEETARRLHKVLGEALAEVLKDEELYRLQSAD